MSNFLELSSDRYVLYDYVMYPLAPQHERNTRKDYDTKIGRHFTSTSFSFAFDHLSSSHHVDDENDEENEGTSHVSIPSPIRYVNSLSNEISQVFTNPLNDEQNMKTLFNHQTEILNHQVEMRNEHKSGLRDLTQEDDGSHTLSAIAKSSSPSLHNAPSKIPSTKETLPTLGTTSSSFESKPHSSPLSSRNTPFGQPTNPFLDNLLDAPPRPSNPLPVQSHPSLDITLSVSPITPLDHIFKTLSLPPPPLPLP
nr:hypothetical protein [Tanacetum cinerariifolium]